MDALTPAPLKKLTSVLILGVSYDLAQNGNHCHLVENKEPDAYCRPVARKVNLQEWMDVPEVQALLDLLGESYGKITALEEELARSHAALQREAGPDTSRTGRPQVTAREAPTSVPGILDETRETGDRGDSK